MRKSKTLARIRNGEPVRICALGHFLPPYIKYAAHFGFDCVWLDLEHRAMDQREVQALMAFFHKYDIDCMLRPSTLEKAKLYRYLEDGASGLMVPHVSTPEKAKALVEACKFPPLGDRGLDGAGLDNDYMLFDEDYPARTNAETFLVVQIETVEAVENVDAIAATEGVDGMFIGLGDLGFRLKQSNDYPSLEEAVEKVATAAKKHGKAWGCPAGSADALRKRRSQGAQLLARGGEVRTMLQVLGEWQKEMDGIL
ncbi:MAG: aldolase/citrate lyase family protein [Verrucomicrobia bacterium]|nr:aldolase/citrate lyase family protein [Verrucomicrobiota bacterium]